MTENLKTIKAEKGQALVIVLVLLVVGMLVITPFLYLTSALSKRVQASEKEVYGFYAADAAVEYGLFKLIHSVPYNGVLPESINGMQTDTDIRTLETVPDADYPDDPEQDFNYDAIYHWIMTAKTYKSGQLVSHVVAKVKSQSPRLGGVDHVIITNWTVQ